MGEPVVPTASERANVLDLARRIVESVRNDEPFPPCDVRSQIEALADAVREQRWRPEKANPRKAGDE